MFFFRKAKKSQCSFYIMKIAHNNNKAGEKDEEEKGSQKNDRFA